MSQNIGTLVSATLRANDSLDNIAIVFSNETKGGHHSVATINERNLIIEQRKQLGMLCTVYNDGVNNATYKLDALPNTWSLFSSNQTQTNSWLTSVIGKINIPPNAPSIGDRYLIDVQATGLFAGFDGKITDFTNSGWVYTTPKTSDCITFKNESNGIWRYLGTYPNGIWDKQILGGLSIKKIIENETIEVPLNYQYFIYGNLTIGSGGVLTNYGEVITLNGDLIIESDGLFNNYGNYSAPINERKKYSITIDTISNQEFIINHHLETTDLICQIYESNVPYPFTMRIINNNSLGIMTTNSVNVRVNVIA